MYNKILLGVIRGVIDMAAILLGFMEVERSRLIKYLNLKKET